MTKQTVEVISAQPDAGCKNRQNYSEFYDILELIMLKRIPSDDDYRPHHLVIYRFLGQLW